MAFIVRNSSSASFILQDQWLYQEFAPNEGGVDLEDIFSHQKLYYSSLAPSGALWLALQSGQLVRRSNDNTIDLPFGPGTGPGTALYDAVWRYAANEGQWEALVGTFDTPSDLNRYVTELDFGVASVVTTSGIDPEILYTVEVPLNSVMMLQAWVTAARTGGPSGQLGDGATFVKIGTLKNINGTLSLKITESAYTFRDQSTWRVYLEPSGQGCNVRVQGAAGNNITWSGKTRWQVQKF